MSTNVNSTSGVGNAGTTLGESKNASRQYLEPTGSISINEMLKVKGKSKGRNNLRHLKILAEKTNFIRVMSLLGPLF